MTTDTRNVFIVRMSMDGFREYALENSKVVIGWADLDGLREAKDSDPARQRENIRETLRKSGWYESERAIGNAAGSIDRFIFSISKGDYIIFPVSKGFYLADVVGGGDGQALFNEAEKDNDRAWQWDVSWRKDKGKPRVFPRTILLKGLYSSLKVRATCHQLAPGSNVELEKSIKRDSGIDVNRIILEEDKNYVDRIKEAIQNIPEPNNFEDFIMKMLQKEGALKVDKLPKNTALKGDVDINAVFRVNCMGGDDERRDEFTYGYQCKHHVGETDESAVRQLIDRVKDDKNDISYQKLFAVTSGYHGKTAKDLAEEFNKEPNSEHERDLPEIHLVDGKDLARWMIELGLRDLEIFKNE